MLTSALCSGAKGAPSPTPRQWFGAPLLTTNVGLPEYDQELGGETGVMEAQRPAAMRESTEGRGIEEARVAIGPMAGPRWPLRAGRLPDHDRLVVVPTTRPTRPSRLDPAQQFNRREP
jgi:hypothetical protein